MQYAAIDHAQDGRNTIRNLRSCQSQHAETRPDRLYQLTQALTNAWYSFSLMFCSKTECENSTCKYYGHIINKASWSGAFPRCADCGIVIDDPKMLRSASVKTKEEKVEWRRYVDNKLVRTNEILI